MEKKIIINADDFGLTSSVNNAIIDVYKKGNLTSTTLMVNMPGTNHAVQLARENKELKIGLHFCITEGYPLSNCTSLIDKTGKFLNRNILNKQILMSKVLANDIKNEFCAQLDKFGSFLMPLSHVDSHQHIHMNQFVFKAILPIIEKRKIPLRLVYPILNHSLIFKRPLKYLKQFVLYNMSKRMIKAMTVPHNDCLVSIHDLASLKNVNSTIYEKFIMETQKRKCIEIMVHPFIIDNDLLLLYQDNIKNKMPF